MKIKKKDIIYMSVILLAVIEIGRLLFSEKDGISEEDKIEVKSDRSANAETIKLQLATMSLEKQKSEATRIAEMTEDVLEERSMEEEKVETQEITLEKRLEMGRFYDEIFQKEYIDQKWASETEKAAADLVYEIESVDTSVLENECRNTMCRLKIGNRTEEDAKKAVKSLIGTPPFNTGGYIYPDAESKDGDIITVIFLSREGYAMQMLEN